MNAIETMVARIRKGRDERTAERAEGASRRRRVAGRLQVEGLEGRQMMTAGIGYNAYTGLVTVQGTTAAEMVLISTLNNEMTVSATSNDGSAPAIRTFKTAGVSKLAVYCGAGDDRVINATAVPMIAYGQSGRDILIGGTAADGIDGGDGNDLIDGGAGNDVLQGGAANDLVLGNVGDDVIGGGSGNDFLHGGAGSDSVYGHDGNDLLAGGGGFDRLIDTLGSNRFLDSSMSFGRMFGQYQGSRFDSYTEGHSLGENLQLGDVLQATRRKASTLFTGYGAAVDQIIASGYSTVEQNLALVGGVGRSLEYKLLDETMDAMYPAS